MGFGILILTLNPYFFSFVFHFELTGRGIKAEPSYWSALEGTWKSVSCQRPLRFKKGIFCANFSHNRGRFAPCRSCWCGKCYSTLDRIDFPIKKNVDEDWHILEDPSGKDRFMVSRNRDHLMVPFQCELCHFRNIYGRNPQNSNLKDKEFLCLHEEKI